MKWNNLEKKIYKNVMVVSAVILIAASVLFSVIFYDMLSDTIVDQLKDETHITAKALEDAPGFTQELAELKANRFTLIQKDGTVIFDNTVDASTLENHRNRKEVIEAFEKGESDVTRRSVTLQREAIYVAVRVNDNLVVRASKSQNSVLGIFLNALPLFFVVYGVVLVAGAIISKKMAKALTKPLGAIKLDRGADLYYEEFIPLSRQIEKQFQTIDEQSLSLRQKDDNLHLVLSQMNEGLIILDSDRNIVLINNKIADIFKAPYDLKGENILYLTRNQEIYNGILTAEENGTNELRFKTANRIYKLFFTKTDDGYISIIFVDITDSERARQIRTEFSSNVSHELKTPLSNIAGYSEIILNGIAKDKDIMPFVKKINEESAHMIEIINDIFMLSKLEENKWEDITEEVHLDAVAISVFSELKSKAYEKSVELRTNGSAVIEGNRYLMYELIYNLVDNAINYNKPFGHVQLSLKEDKDNGRIEITVADSGIGIKDENKDRIFERFYREDKSRDKKSGGTGLGLSIVKHTVNFCGGSLEVADNIPEGSVFRVVLPAKGKN